MESIRLKGESRCVISILPEGLRQKCAASRRGYRPYRRLGWLWGSPEKWQHPASWWYKVLPRRRPPTGPDPA